MSTFLSSLELLIIPQVVTAIIGGFLGVACLWKSFVSVYGYILTSLFSVIGLVSAGAASEFFFNSYGTSSIFYHCLIGCGAGVLGVSGIDALRLLAPKIMKKIIDATGNTAVNIIKKRGE